MNAFQPLNFLGSVYTAVVKALIDMQNLNQLLMENPDVVDKPGAKALPAPARSEKGLGLKFDHVTFNYPEQPAHMVSFGGWKDVCGDDVADILFHTTQGLKDVSFTVEPGTTTALVGHTGSGKTTTARLLFRFYDTVSGRVLINGYVTSSFSVAL